MNQDLETSPLLGHSRTGEVAEDINPAAAQQSAGQRGNRIKWVVIIVLLSILTSFITYGTYVFNRLPSQDVIEDSIIKVSNWQIEKVHIDGWRRGGHLDTEGGDALQLSVKAIYWPDYDRWIRTNSTKMTLRDKSFYRSVSEKLVRTVCLTINNATTYDGLQTINNTVGTLQVKNEFCLDLRNNVTTPLNLTILIEPEMNNIIRVLKKIWRHEYDKLNLSSELDISLSKQVGWTIPMARLHAVQINWKKFLNWGSISDGVHSLRHRFDKIAIQNFSLKDSSNGFFLQASAEPLLLPPLFEWVNLPQNATVPSIDWEVRVPDCKNNFTINLPSVSCFTDPLNIRETINITVSGDIEGPLPRQLISQVCWSDEENAVTPMTLLLNRILNATELVTVEIKGNSVAESFTDHSIVPHHVLQSFLHDVSYFPITANITVESDSLIQEVTIDALKVRWVRSIFGEKKLRVSGTIIGTIALPFYNTNKEKLSVEYIKGQTKLYHQGVHFLDVPMRYWTKSNSRIYEDEQERTTMMELSLSVRDDEVQIVNNLELTRILNEVVFTGESPVHIESELDVMVSSPLGEMVLMGLKGKGDTTLRS